MKMINDFLYFRFTANEIGAEGISPSSPEAIFQDTYAYAFTKGGVGHALWDIKENRWVPQMEVPDWVIELNKFYYEWL